MIKVLIVDDELLARLALKTAIAWEEHGFEVVAEAEDGLTGFQYVQKYRPHIMLTDISMPGMNGVELIKKTKEFFPDTEIIILSCHNDFEYVKEGLRSGAANYILKLSMSMEELLGELILLKEKILKRDVAEIGSTLVSEKELWPELLFSLMVEEELSDEQQLLKARQTSLIGDGDYVVFAVIAVDCQEEDFERYSLKGIIENLVEAVMTRYKIGTYIPFEYNRGVILCQTTGELEYKEKADCLKTMLEELLGLIYDCHGITASAGISEVCTIRQMKCCYRQAYSALSRKFYLGPGKIHKAFKENLEQGEEISGKYFKELLKTISTYDFGEVKKATKLWLDAVADSQYPSIGVVKKNIHELLFQIESTILLAEVNSELVEGAYHHIQKQMYLEEMRKTLAAFYESAENFSENAKDSKREIVLARKYVGLYYGDNIKLTDVAEYVNMNVNYFSHLFKKETGSTFTAYLTEFRIDKAKSLLQSGQYKVYESAFAVGFQDENYFIKCFKKQTGYTPYEFMRT